MFTLPGGALVEVADAAGPHPIVGRFTGVREP
ncbi:hypothetical protein BJ996_000610 [Streptomyces phaeogriseichromatogenes]|nr:hypothetical protein [Streptomyces murinus]